MMARKSLRTHIQKNHTMISNTVRSIKSAKDLNGPTTKEISEEILQTLINMVTFAMY